MGGIGEYVKRVAFYAQLLAHQLHLIVVLVAQEGIALNRCADRALCVKHNIHRAHAHDVLFAGDIILRRLIKQNRLAAQRQTDLAALFCYRQEVGNADKGIDKAVCRAADDLFVAADLADLSVRLHDGDSVAELERRFLIVRDVDDRRADVLLDHLDFQNHLLAELRVQIGDRLVEHELAAVELNAAALLERVGDLLRRDGAEQTSGAAALGKDGHGQVAHARGDGAGLLALALALFLHGLVIHAHGVDVIGRRLNGQLARQHVVAGVAVGDLDHLAALALAADILL